MSEFRDLIIESMSTGVLVIDADEVIVSCNPAAAQIAGRDRVEIIGEHLTDLASLDSNATFIQAVREAQADRRLRRLRHRSADDGRAFDNVITPAEGFVVIEFTDVTAEVKSNEERDLRMAADAVASEIAGETLVIVDLVANTVYADSSFTRLADYDRFERIVTEGRLLDYLHCPHSYNDPWRSVADLIDGRVERSIAEVFTTGEPQRHRHSLPLPDGTTRYWSTRLAAWDFEGSRRGVVILAQDMTDSVRLARQTRFANEAIAEVLEHLPVQVWDFDMSRGLITRLAGFGATSSAANSAPQPLREVLAELGPEASAQVWGALDRLSEADSATAQVRSADGERWLQAAFRRVPPTDIDPRERAVVVITDVTGQVAAAETSSRLDHALHVMRFAQGVAHDFGNVAQVVGGYAEILQRQPGEAVVAQAATRLSSAARRGVAVSRRIATIARVQQVANGPLDISGLVDAAAPRLQEIVGTDITLTTSILPGLIGIAETEHLVSALENLCENAAQAMAGHGSIAISVAPAAQAGRRFVEVAVADDGPGIPVAILDRVFDPFVTGRPDTGTGLGLYLIQEYLYSVGGEVAVESSPEGATFRLRFPAQDRRSSSRDDEDPRH